MPLAPRVLAFDCGFIGCILFRSRRRRSSRTISALARPAELRHEAWRGASDRARARRRDGAQCPFACRYRSQCMVLWVVESAPAPSRGMSSYTYTWVSRLIQIQNQRRVDEKLSHPTGPCIVDMQKLVKAVMETDPGHTVPHSANILHIQTDTRTCAGDDSLYVQPPPFGFRQ